MSAPRAGRAGTPGRGRGRGIRANSPHLTNQQNSRQTSPVARGGHQASGGHQRATIQGAATTFVVRGRGRGRGGGHDANQLGKKVHFEEQPVAVASYGGDNDRRTSFAFTGDRSWRSPENAARKDYKGKIQGFWETLKRQRVNERHVAIREGKMADPEKKMKLSEAIKTVGTCEDMCPEWERITRIHDGNVLWPEKIRLASGETVTSEEKMVKRFQRSAAGDDEQLPSDLRPPYVLLRTLDYMIDKILAGPEPIERVQEFFWDRTRAIRNDFSIQQVTNVEDVKLAMECFERITRYHIIALHHTRRPGHKPGVEQQQENEQLTNTLTSLLQYYEDNRGKFESPNEPEFRAYYIIREIGQTQRPDLESRVQQWPIKLILDPKVRVALELYAAASDVALPVGPLRPFATICIAQANGMRFWSIINSTAVSYLMACCAESYFRMIRDTTLTNLWKACRRPSKTKLDDLLLSKLTDWLGFDNEDQTQEYCENKGYTIAEHEDGNAFLDLTAAPPTVMSGGGAISSSGFSERLVEDKRHGRLYPALIRGFSVVEARARGFVEDLDGMEINAAPKTTDNDGRASHQSNKADSQPAPVQNVFGQPASANMSNPFASNIGLGPNAFQPVATPALADQQSASQSSNITNPFAKVQFPTQPANRPQPPLTNQEIAAKAFNTPSHSLFAFPGPAASTSFTNAQVKNPFAASDNASSQTIPIPPLPSSTRNKSLPLPQHPFASLFDSPGQDAAHSAPSSGLGTSLFSKPQIPAAAGNRPDAVSPQPPNAGTGESKEAGTQSPEPSLFIPPNGTAQDAPGIGFPQASGGAPLFQHRSESPMQVTPQNRTPLFKFGAEASEPSVTESDESVARPHPVAGTPLVSQAAGPSLISGASPPLTAHRPPQSDGVFTASSTHLPAPPASGQQATTSSLFPKPTQQGHQALPTQDARAAQLPTSGAASSLAQPTPSVGNTFARPHQPTLSSVEKVPSAKPKGPSRDELLDTLVRAFVLGEDGLIRQFVEKEAGMTVRSCIRKVQKEKERERVAAARRFLLSRKYSRLWRDIAWRRKLKHDAKLRRAEFRKSLQDMALSSRASSRATSETAPNPSGSRAVPSVDAIRQMPPPPKFDRLPNHAVSLPVPSKAVGHKSKTFGSSVSKFEARSIVRPPMRASKMSNALASINSSKVDKNIRYGGLSSSMIGESGIMNERLMREASRLIDGRTDTTRTDYFKLKALGIDPNTPIVPKTRKRRNEEDIQSSTRKSRMSPAKSSSSPTILPAINGDNSHKFLPTPASQISAVAVAPGKHDDDELFAQLKSVKSALSETESWYREYREQSERTTADIANETEKQRKLREWKPSPSRTEARRQRDGLPSFLRSSWTPRQTVSREASNSRVSEATPAALQAQVGDDEFVEDEDVCEEAGEEADEEVYDEEEDFVGDRGMGEDDELDGDDEDGSDEGDYNEEDAEEDEDEDGDYDDHDTQAFGGYGATGMTVVNPSSTFAAKGASMDDAIEL